MTVAIRKIAGTNRDYLAYPTTFSGRATCFVYSRTTSGPPSPSTTSHLMLRLACGHRPHLRTVDPKLSLRHPAVLELLRQSAGATQDTDLHPLRSR